MSGGIPSKKCLGVKFQRWGFAGFGMPKPGLRPAERRSSAKKINCILKNNYYSSKNIYFTDSTVTYGCKLKPSIVSYYSEIDLKGIHSTPCTELRIKIFFHSGFSSVEIIVMWQLQNLLQILFRFWKAAVTENNTLEFLLYSLGPLPIFTAKKKIGGLFNTCFWGAMSHVGAVFAR